MALNQNEIRILAEKIIRMYKQKGLPLSKEDEKNIINLIDRHMHVLQNQHPAVVCRLICAVVMLQVAAKHNPHLALLQKELISLAVTPMNQLTHDQKIILKRCLAEEHKFLQHITTLELLPPELIMEMTERFNQLVQDLNQTPENTPSQPIGVLVFLDVAEQENVCFLGVPGSILTMPIAVFDLTDSSAPVVNIDYEMHKKGAHRITEDSQHKQEAAQAMAAVIAEPDPEPEESRRSLPRPLPPGHPDKGKH